MAKDKDATSEATTDEPITLHEGETMEDLTLEERLARIEEGMKTIRHDVHELQRLVHNSPFAR